MNRDDIPMPKGYKALNVLGEGAFGKVIECFKQDTQEVVAIKFSKDNEDLSWEAMLMEKLMRHRMDKYNIVKFHGSTYCRGWRCLVFESLEITLHKYIWRKEQAMPLSDIRSVIQQLAEAFKALKRLGVIHTDVKSDNVMVVDQRQKPLRVKLIDFGEAIRRSEASQGMLVQTTHYRAPEILLGIPFSEAIDIWSLGCLMGLMLFHNVLNPARNSYDAVRFISDLMGPPPKYLLNAGRYSRKYFKETFSKQMILKTPEEYWGEDDNLSFDRRMYTFRSLEKLKQNTRNVERRECIDLLMAIFRWDGRVRITPSGILKHPFITQSYVKDESPESASAKPSTNTGWDQAPTNSHHDNRDETLESAPAKPSTSCAQTPSNGDRDDRCQSAEDYELIRTSPVCSPLVTSHKKKNCFKRFWSWMKTALRHRLMV